MAVWGGLGQAATVAQLIGADVGGLISSIIKAAATARQNKKDCKQLARRVFMIAELLQHLQDPEVLRQPEVQQPLAELKDTLLEAHELVESCQEKSGVYQLVMAGRQAERFRDIQSRIDSYLIVFPLVSYIDITRRLDRIYRVLLPNDTSVPSPSAGSRTHEQMFREVLVQGGDEGERFTFADLVAATNNFAQQIGRGAFGSVYIGRLTGDGREVAIKRIDNKTTKKGFPAEGTILPFLRHKHIIRLYGSCVLKQKKCFLRKNKVEESLLVYEYMENGTLYDHLLDPHCSSSPLRASWKMRIETLLGVSRAIEYLHSYAVPPVIHRDIKPSNILFDSSWVPHLSDFGVAIIWDEVECSDLCICGTLGYIEPDYLMTGNLKPASDVYSFGVVMIQVLTGKKVTFQNNEYTDMMVSHMERTSGIEDRETWTHNSGEVLRGSIIPTSLIDTVLPLIEEGELREVLDRRPAREPTARQLEAVELVAQTAVRCVRLQRENRPAISEVVANLEEALELVRGDGLPDLGGDASVSNAN